MAKITLATFKKFISSHVDDLYLKVYSSFDGMVDCVVGFRDAKFIKVTQNKDDYAFKSNMGIKGVWLVGGSRDYFEPFEDNEFMGISVSNCCGHYALAIKK